ncbi:MAG: hypothetical protein ACKOCK_10750, partial [Chloroflexota bacterium]
MNRWSTRPIELGLLAVAVAFSALFTAAARFSPLDPPISGSWWWILGLGLLVTSIALGFTRPTAEQTMLAIAALLVICG